MTSHPAVTHRLRAHHVHVLRRLVTLVGALALLTWLGAAVASAQVVPSGGDFQSTPTTWTATALTGTLNTVSASQAFSGTNGFYRTQYTTPANLLGGGLAGMAATEGITSPTFTWSQASPQTLVASYDRGVNFSGLLGVDANAGIGMYLQNLTTGTNTLLIGERLTRNSADFSTVSASVSPALLINGDSYRVQVQETFSPTVQVAGSTTIDLDNVGLAATPATPPAPVLTTNSGQITNVTSSGATADATINPGSADTTVQVAYGTTTAYGTTISGQALAANSGASPVSIPISGLSPSTTYHAQITATNAGGSVSTGDLTFTTPAATPTTPPPTTGSGSAQGAAGERTATVGTTINDAGAGSTYYVEYGTSTNYGMTTSPQTNPAGTVGSTAVSTGLSGLAPNTTYHAQYVVTSSGGTADGGDFTFTTAPLSPPTIGATGARTTSNDGTQETVNAVVNPGANDTQVSVSYGATSSYGNTTSSVLVPAGSGQQTVTIPISGLTAGNTYHYQVTATNADGTVTSTDATFTPTAPPNPTIGQTTVSSGPGEYSAGLASTINTGGSSGSYYLQYGTTTAYGSQTATQTLDASSNPQQLNAALTGLTPGTTYHAQFVATVNGQPTYGTDIQFTTAPASPPTITSGPSAATSDSAGDQELITANVDPGAHDTQVLVSYGTSSAYGTTTPATTVSANSGSTTVSIPLTGLNPGTTYHYQVTATNADGNVSSTDQTFTPTSSTSPPVGPSAATNGPGQHSVTLGSSIDTGGNGGNYYVQYGTDTTYGSTTTPQNLTATGGSQPLSASITGLQPGTTYHAQFVVSVDGHPASYGADYTFTTTAPPTFVSGPTAATSDNGGDQETVSAVVNPGGVQTTVTVAYGPDSSYGSTSSSATVAANAGAQTVQIPISGLTPGNTYHYQVTATNANGSVSTTDNTFTPTTQTTPAVGATSVTSGPGESTVTLSSSINTGGNGGNYYLQYGTTTGYGTPTTPQSLSSSSSSQTLTASLTGLQPGTTYHAQFVATVNGHTSYGSDYTFTTAPLSPPTFGTGGTNAVTASADGTQETISTVVNPGSHNTTVSVSYGTTSAYGSTANASSALAAGSGASNVSVTLTGLNPGITYHYQVNATNSDGTVHTVDATFSPTASTHPPVGPTSAAQGPGSSSVTLDSSVNTGGNGGTYYIEYSTDTSYGNQTPSQSLTTSTTSQPLSALLSGLAPGTTYHARFVVLVDGYATAYGSDYTFTTAPAATNDTISAVNAQTATVQVTVDPGASDTTVYAVYGPTSAYGSRTNAVTVPANSGPTTVTLPLTGLTPGDTYYVQFVIGNASSSLRTSAMSFTTLGASGTTTTSSTTTTTTGTTTTTPPPPTRTSRSACVAAYVATSSRTLRMLSVPAAAQLTASHGLRVVLTRRVKMAGTATFALSGGPRTKIRGRAFTITRAQLRSGSTTVVRVAIPQRGHRKVIVSLRISAASCGIALTSARVRSSLLLRLRLPLGAHRVTFTLPRAMASPTALTVTTSTGTRTLALAGRGAALHLRRRAGALRVSARGSSITVSGLGQTTTGLALRFPRSRASGTVTARVSQLSGGTRSVRVLVGARRRTAR